MKRKPVQPEKRREYQDRYYRKKTAQGTEWFIWLGIRRRCYRPSDAAFRWYGARGIKMCDDWKNDFQRFLADVGRRPSRELTIERIDNNGDYEPGNIRWATRKNRS